MGVEVFFLLYPLVTCCERSFMPSLGLRIREANLLNQEAYRSSGWKVVYVDQWMLVAAISETNLLPEEETKAGKGLWKLQKPRKPTESR